MSEVTGLRGRTLWSMDDAARDAECLPEAWRRLFGEEYDRTRAIAEHDLGDATAYVMPGGYVACESFPANTSIHAPEKDPGANEVFGVVIAPRDEPYISVLDLPFVKKLPVINASRHVRGRGEGEKHLAQTRMFTRTDWYGVVYIVDPDYPLPADELERVRHYYTFAPHERVLAEVKDLLDGFYVCAPDIAERLSRLAEVSTPFYVSNFQKCAYCGGKGTTRPWVETVTRELDGSRYDMGDWPGVRCDACRKVTLYNTSCRLLQCATALRALRLGRRSYQVMRAAREALDLQLHEFYHLCTVPTDGVRQPRELEESGDEVLAKYLIKRLEDYSPSVYG